jgi:cbb3-type cytochrome oxidase maturation protein
VTKVILFIAIGHVPAGSPNLLLTRKTKTYMGVIFILIGASLIVAMGFLAAFLWSVKSGQYDDDYTPSVRILLDDKTTESSKNKK